MKTGVENDIFYFKKGSGYGEPGGTSPPRTRGKKTLLSSLNSVRCKQSEVQWNPALRPLFFWPSGKMAIHFLANKKPSLMRSPVNTAKCFWPIGHRINGVPLYIISTGDTYCCYIVVLIPVLNILGAVQL